MLTTSRHKLGKYGEDLAEVFLKEKGFHIIEKNWKKAEFGEIDIVAGKNDTLVFVEVKTQIGSDYKEPEEAVDERKIRALARVSWIYSQEHSKLPQSLRIDVVSVILNENLSIREIKLFENVHEEF